MSYRHIRGYVLLVVSGLALALAAVLALQQLGNRSTVTILTWTQEANTLVVVLFSAGAGVVLFYMVRMLLGAIRDLRSGPKGPSTP